MRAARAGGGEEAAPSRAPTLQQRADEQEQALQQAVKSVRAAGEYVLAMVTSDEGESLSNEVEVEACDPRRPRPRRRDCCLAGN